jgi:FtsP/CotA-like multicopper oxidase with cupredoxin domain
MNSKRFGARLAAGTSAVVLSLGSGAACAAEFWLKAEATTVTMPGAVAVPMWAYAKCTDATFLTCAPATVPGPALVVPPGEGLTVNLKNNLPANTSLVIPGQVTTMTPVWNDGASGTRISPTARVRSFTHEAVAAGGTAVYSWPTLKPGTYLYHSGTHPQVQMQMGLYGAMSKDFAAGQAYPGVAYDNQVTLLYSEIDPALHNAVGGPTPTYGTVTGPTSTLKYVPKFFLVNGKAHVTGDPAIATIAVGKTTLLRFLNAGLRTHVPVVNGPYMKMIAEDGSPYPWPANPRERYSVFLPAAKTTDVTLTPPPGGVTRIAIFDRALALTNDKAPDGGMIAFLDVGDVGSPPIIDSTPLALTATQGQLYTYQVVAHDPDGGVLTYSLDAAPAGMTINSATGLVSWTPAAPQLGPYTVTVRVTDPTARFVTQTFTLTVAADPAATLPVITSTAPLTATYGVAYSYPVTATGTAPLVYALDVAPAGMTLNATTGLVAWTPTKAQALAGTANVVVRVTQPNTVYATQSFTIAVADANYPPVAVNDAYSMVQGGTLTVAAPGVLANDSDPDADAITAALVAAPVGLTLNANGSFTYTPPATLTGPSTFTYQARDAGVTPSNTATVTITIAANRPPLTVSDTFNVAARTTVAYVPVVMNVLANDSDPDTALDPTNRINAATVTISTAPNKAGVVTVNADGTVSYTPARNFRGTEIFAYKVRDTRGALSAATTVRVNVR